MLSKFGAVLGGAVGLVVVFYLIVFVTAWI